LTGTNVVALATTICRQHIGELHSEPVGRHVDTIADARVVDLGIGKISGHDASRNVDYVIDRPASIWIATEVASQHAEPLLLEE
jgi:hypothetical protein